MLLSPYESAAHREVLSALADLWDNVISDDAFARRFARAADCFSPRCTRCRAVLSVKPEVGRRVFSCGCGHTFQEHL